VRDNVFINNETFLMTDFRNLKIKPVQSFESIHMDILCMRMFIRVSAYMCMIICVYTVFLKKDDLYVSYICNDGNVY
jgi:hypothetical protein